jgi:hypothetical protein
MAAIAFKGRFARRSRGQDRPAGRGEGLTAPKACNATGNHNQQNEQTHRFRPLETPKWRSDGQSY